MKYKLKKKSENPINFHFQDADILIGNDPIEVDTKYAESIIEHYPDWIEEVKVPQKGK